MDAADLAFAGLARQAELVRDGTVSSRELTELCLERIARLDPQVRAFRVVLADAALAEADAADARRGDGAPPLNGVPIAIKDDTDVAGEVTAHGSLAHGGPVAEDAEVVRRLRAAGAVVVGKTHVPELEALATTESLAFGATHNPWDLARIAGGSSGGSAAAVAAGMVGAALATDGAGSIRIPAACCGLVGLKPQRGRVPMRSDWHGMTVTGAVTRGVLDTARFLDAVADGSPGYADAVAAPRPALRVAVSYKVPRGIVVRLGDEQRAAVDRTAERLRELGHVVVERDPDYGNAGINVTTRYLEGIRSDAAEMPHPERLARWTRGLASMGSKLPGFLVTRAHAQAAADRDRAGALFAEFDALLTPVFTRGVPRIGEWLGLPAPLMLNAMSQLIPYLPIWNHTGNPAVALPVETDADGLPLAVQLVAPTDGEPVLLGLAAQLEAAMDWTARRPPLAA